MQPKKDVNHMAMPSWPGAVLIMIHSELALSFFEALLDGPPHDGGFAHLRERHLHGCIGEGEFGFPIRAGSDKEPYRILLGKSFSGGIDPEAGHLSDDGSLGTFSQDDRFPVTFARTCKHGYGLGLGLAG
jgi:hypothetical protein